MSGLYGGYRLAGWWSRVGAALLDTLVLGTVGVLIRLAIGQPALKVHHQSTSGALLLLGISIAISLVYFPLLMVRTDGRTLGKLAVGIRVIRTDGKPMSLGLAAFREVLLKELQLGLTVVDVFARGIGFIGLLDYLWPLWDGENRAIHDMLAGTRVVHTERTEVQPGAPGQPSPI